MAFSISKLFNNQKSPVSPNSNIVGTTLDGNVVVSSSVNWKKEGINNAGTAQGDSNAFRAGFQSCFARTKKSQEIDQALQDKMKKQLQNEKIALEGNLATEKDKLDGVTHKLQTAKDRVEDKKREITDVQQGIVNKEKTIRLNFIIGTLITAFLTIYLFIFYSSTAYSAFFRNFDVSDNVQEAMFDGNAIFDAFSSSFFQGCFILFMPVIFLGLGYVAYSLSVSSSGLGKYAKIGLLYLLTFAFDFLLAYKISWSFYDLSAALSLSEIPPFSIGIAFQDMDFWIVIFCGFVSYVIWGLVFSFTMNHYDRLTNNKYELDALRGELDSLQGEVVALQSDVSGCQQKINTLDAEIKQKTNELDTAVRYDYNQIKQSLADYFLGWTSFFALSGQDTSALNTIYKSELDAVDNWSHGQIGKLQNQ